MGKLVLCKWRIFEFTRKTEFKKSCFFCLDWAGVSRFILVQKILENDLFVINQMSDVDAASQTTPAVTTTTATTSVTPTATAAASNPLTIQLIKDMFPTAQNLMDPFTQCPLEELNMNNRVLLYQFEQSK